MHSGTDGLSRGQREKFVSETTPKLMVNRKESGVIGGDFNCITRAHDCTNNQESKMSPSLKRLISTFSLQDSFLKPNTIIDI